MLKIETNENPSTFAPDAQGVVASLAAGHEVFRADLEEWVELGTEPLRLVTLMQIIKTDDVEFWAGPYGLNKLSRACLATNPDLLKSLITADGKNLLTLACENYRNGMWKVIETLIKKGLEIQPVLQGKYHDQALNRDLRRKLWPYINGMKGAMEAPTQEGVVRFSLPPCSDLIKEANKRNIEYVLASLSGSSHDDFFTRPKMPK